MNRKMKLVLLVLMEIVSLVVGKKILGLFPHPGISHFNVFKPVLLALAERGHELEVASYFPMDAPVKNYKDLTLRGQDILTGTTDLKVIMFGTSQSKACLWF
jgi:glucuronosyltransferase